MKNKKKGIESKEKDLLKTWLLQKEISKMLREGSSDRNKKKKEKRIN